MGKTGPCKNCNDRCVGCHASCLRYIDWTQQNSVLKECKREQESIDRRLRAMNKIRKEKAHDYYYKDAKKNH